MGNPLVSVVVITYNSAKYVLETLDSIKNQTYTGIEMIITDDCSTDNTVEICKKWAEENSKYLSDIKVLDAEKNTGIPGNCNRGIKASNAEWIKLIAGDDLLISDCIGNFLHFIKINKDASIVYSKSLGFYGNIKDENFGNHHFPGYKKFFNADRIVQYKMLLRRNYCDGPTVFFKKTAYDSVGGFSEKYRFEDHPFALNLSKNNFRLYYLNTYTVYYRENIISITRVGGNKLFSTFYTEVEKFNELEIYPHSNTFLKICKKFNFKTLHFMDKFGLNQKTKFSKFLFLAAYYINPLHIYNKFY